jgi:hypothetical protein
MNVAPTSDWDLALGTMIAQALGDCGASIFDLLDHACRKLQYGRFFGNSSTLAAIQAAGRIAGVQPLFERIPAAALGRKGFLSNPWPLLGYEDDSFLDDYSVTAVMNEIGGKKLNEFPCFVRASFPYNVSSTESALWALHERMAVLTLLCLGPFLAEMRSDLSQQALQAFGGFSVEPVLNATKQWAGERLVSAADTELARRSKAEKA